MGRLIPLAVAAVVALAVGIGGTLLLSGGDDDDGSERTIAPVAAPADPAGGARDRPARIAVDDGVTDAEAARAARRAADHARGQAVSVDLDDGRYEVEVQRPDGALVEVLLDGSLQVLGVEQDEGDALVGD